MFKLRPSFIIILFLVVPFCLKLIGFEPYPCIVLPSGGIVIKRVNNKTTFEDTQIYGLDSTGKWNKINKQQFMDPIPIHYLEDLTDRNFGLDKSLAIAKSRKVRILKMLHLYKGTPNETVEEKNITEIKFWLGRKLADQHLDNKKIKVVSFIRTVSLQTGALISSKITNERIIDLFK